MHKLITIAGKVVLPDGKPAEGAAVTVTGDGYQMDGLHVAAKADASGEPLFRLPAAPGFRLP